MEKQVSKPTKNMNIIQRIRRFVIIKSAENKYENMCQRCIELWKQTGQHHYIIIDQIKGDRITLTNRAHYRLVKRAINDSGYRMRASGQHGIVSKTTMYDVHDGCFYSSLLQYNLEQMKDEKKIQHARNEMEARKRAYINWVLDNVKTPAERRKERRQSRMTWKEKRVVRRLIKEHKMGNKKSTAI